jgi:hypothetical protein
MWYGLVGKFVQSVGISKLGRWDIECCLEQQDDAVWKLCMCLDCIAFLFLVFVFICFYIYIYFLFV